MTISPSSAAWCKLALGLLLQCVMFGHTSVPYDNDSAVRWYFWEIALDVSALFILGSVLRRGSNVQRFLAGVLLVYPAIVFGFILMQAVR